MLLMISLNPVRPFLLPSIFSICSFSLPTSFIRRSGSCIEASNIHNKDSRLFGSRDLPYLRHYHAFQPSVLSPSSRDYMSHPRVLSRVPRCKVSAEPSGAGKEIPDSFDLHYHPAYSSRGETLPISHFHGLCCRCRADPSLLTTAYRYVAFY